MRKLKFILLLLCLPAIMLPLPYGKNKINFKQLEWKQIPTNNFEFYFTLKNENLAREMAIFSEETYAELVADLKVTPYDPIKLFIYDSPIDFEQTNITGDIIDEGVGGFTESLKGRIALPFVTSPKRMREVVKHEMTHALQFESLYGGFGHSYKLLKALFIPNWVMEGMAEYEATDYDTSITDMLLRDGVMNNRIKGLDYLGSFNYMEGRDVVLMYKESQFVFDFMAKTYGKDKVNLVLKEFGYLANTQESVIPKVLGIEYVDFDKKWQYALKEKYLEQAKGKKEASDYAVKLTKDEGFRPAYNTRPVFSADGSSIYFYFDGKNYTALCEYVIKTGAVNEILGREYDSYAQQGNALSVNPLLGKLAFASKAAGKQMIRILDLKEKYIVFESDFGLDYAYSPCFEPVVIKSGLPAFIFIGVKNGRSDVYYCDNRGISRRLTDDRFDDTEAVFSPDGKDIYYVSERDNGYRSLFKIAGWREQLEQKSELFLAGNNKCNITAPVFTQDGKLVFSADYNGIYNLYVWDSVAPGEVKQLTDIRGGIFSPDVSRDGKKVVFSYFEESCYNLYLMDLAEEKALATVPAEKQFPYSNADRKDYKLSNLPLLPYRLSLSMDLIYFLAGYDSASGLVGGGYISFSDLLGENNFEFYAAAVKSLQSGAQFSYMNNAWRVNFGATIYTWRTYGSTLYSDGTLAGNYYTEETGLTLPFRYPLDRYNRLQLSFNSYIKDHFFYEGIGDNDRSITNSLAFSFVNDRLSYSTDEPCAGGAFNLSLERADYVLWGTKNFLNVMAETVQYVFLEREMTVAARLFAGTSIGTDKGHFNLGAGVLRGYYNDEYRGDSLLLCNLELRLPLIEKMELNVWPANWILIKKIKLCLFSDQAVAFNSFSAVNAGDLKNSLGVGLRIHGFIWQSFPVILRLDAGYRTDGGATPIYHIGLGHIF